VSANPWASQWCMMVRIIVPGEPRPWTVWAKRGPKPDGFVRMEVWQAQIQAAVRAGFSNEPLSGPLQMETVFVRGYPDSAPKTPSAQVRWSEKHILTKPDLTNYQKACEDALIGLLFHDDNQVVQHNSSKTYGYPGKEPYTIIEVREG